jgi:two-component system, response regulator YesN
MFSRLQKGGGNLDVIYDRCAKMAVHFSGLTGADCTVLETSPLALVFSQPKDSFCSSCLCQKCQALNTHYYGCSEAYRWSGKYIYYCPLGLVFAASCVSDERGQLAGGLIAGPMVMGDLQDTLSEQTDKEIAENIAILPVFSTAKVNHLAEILAASTAQAAGIPQSLLGPFAHEQEKMLNMLYEMKETRLTSRTDTQYFIDSEKQLIDLIDKRDKAGAQLLLNEMLGHIFVYNDFDFDSIKMRLIEMAVQLSRSTIDAGADINDILLFNANDMRAIDSLTGIEELSVWITGIMHRFVNYAFDFTQIKLSDVVYKVMEYVKANYHKKITLDDVARHVYLSRSYLSSVFKEETGESLFSYINKVRVEKSKQYLSNQNLSLLDISALCGFEDQSYFTKVFKKSTGMSPGAYRNSRKGILVQ